MADKICLILLENQSLPVKEILFKDKQNKDIEYIFQGKIQELGSPPEGRNEFQKDLSGDLLDLLRHEFGHPSDWSDLDKRICIHLTLVVTETETETLVYATAALHGKILSSIVKIYNGDVEGACDLISCEDNPIFTPGAMHTEVIKTTSAGECKNSLSLEQNYVYSTSTELNKKIEEWTSKWPLVTFDKISISYRMSSGRNLQNEDVLRQLLDCQNTDVVLVPPPNRSHQKHGYDTFRLPCHWRVLKDSSFKMLAAFESKLTEMEFNSYSERTARAFLLFIYTGDVTVPRHFENVSLDLLKIAEYYSMPQLKEKIVTILQCREPKYWDRSVALKMVDLVENSTGFQMLKSMADDLAKYWKTEVK